MSNKKNSLMIYLILIFFGILMLLPFIWMILSSFKSNSEIISAAATFFPHQFIIQNYKKIFYEFHFLNYFKNSFIIAATKTTIIVYTSCLCGYVFSKYHFMGKNILFGFILATMMIPWPVTIIPLYDLMDQFNWIDSYASLIIPTLISSFGVFMMRQFISNIPDDLIQAARIDGASEFYIFHRIIMPLSKNAISSIAIFHFLWSWEDFLWPYLMINDEAKQLLPVALNNFNGRNFTNYGGLFAATTLSILPVLIVYLFFQKRFIEGMATSGLKG